jgi:outer membrane protein OmpA-like peptidoglycan-associated protein
MILKTPLTLLTLGAFTLAGCVTTTEDNRRQNTGALTGAILGGALGASSKGDDKLLKTVVGAGIGAAIGGAIGSSLDQQAAELRNSIGDNRVSITNTGSELIVNLPQDILFATDSATLRGDLTQDLQAVARSLLNYPNTTVQVLGHTDNTGSAAYNQNLSQRTGRPYCGDWPWRRPPSRIEPVRSRPRAKPPGGNRYSSKLTFGGILRKGRGSPRSFFYALLFPAFCQFLFKH